MKRLALATQVLAFSALACPKPATKVADLGTKDVGTKTATASAMLEDPPLTPVDDAASCGACHEAIVAEWSSSLHASAHHSKDELYRAIREMRMKKEGQAIAGSCALCHSPRGLQNPEGRLAQVGVGCASCHLVEEVQAGPGRLGAHALVSAYDGVMRGPHGPGKDGATHGLTAPAAFITDGKTLCLACHDELKSKAGIPVCSTGMEWRANEPPPSCVSCHMPEVEAPSGSVSKDRKTHRSHAFFGPHRAFRDGDIDFMKTALQLSASIVEERIVVRIENKTAHALPTGFPARLLVVQVLGYDRDAQLVFTSFKDNPSQETPEAVFGKVYVDDKGAPTLAPWATKLEKDTRLAAGETRELSMILPASVQRATVKVFFRLLSPPLARQLELDSRPIGGGKVIALVVAAREAAAPKGKKRPGKKR